MKTSKTLVYALTGTALLLASCVNDDKDLYKPTEPEPTKTEDLVVPAGFDWTMTHNVTLSTQSPCATMASLYLDEECTNLIATLPVQEGKGSITLEVPSATSAIWIKYPTAQGAEKMKATINKAITRAGAGSWVANSLFPDYTTNHHDGNGFVYQPAKGKFGTLMFEDMWPEKGDYDFNDFVVNYNMVTEYGEEGASSPYLYTTITLKLRAMGGTYPYRLCIQLFGKHADDDNYVITDLPDIRKEDVEIVSTELSNIEGAGVELLDAQRVILALTGFDKLRESTGGEFYNTQKGRVIASSEATPVIKFKLKINLKRIGEVAWYALNWFSDQYALDYFLQRTDNNREIHISGYVPTELYKNYEKDLAGRTEKPYYCSSDRFVWALKAPEEMSWSVEKQDIISVYSKFGEWVTSGGQLLEDNVNPLKWYSNKYLTKDSELYIDHTKH